MYTVLETKTVPMNDGSISYRVRLQCDTSANMPEVMYNWAVGSELEVLENGGAKYRLGDDRKWYKINFKTGSGGGDNSDVVDQVNQNTSNISLVTGRVSRIETNIGGHTVKSDVPENAVFTDTVYDDSEVKEDTKQIKTDISLVNEKIEDLKAQGIQQTPLFAENVEWLEENGDTSKVYVLPDGYIYAYLYTETIKEPENLIPTATDADRTTIYNGTGFMTGKRINSSGAVVDYSGSNMATTGFMPAKAGDVINVIGWTSNSSYTCYMAAYDSSNNVTGKLTINSATVFPVTLEEPTFGSGFNAIRISGDITDETSVINLSNIIIVSEYKWASTELAFVSAGYEDRINGLEKDLEKLTSTSQKLLGISEVFAPSPQLPADGSETADFNGDWNYITAEHIYSYIDELLDRYPRFITKEVLGKDASGDHDWCRYVCSRRAYDAWQKPNYPPMYAWVNGSTVIYSESVSPRIGDTLYTTTYIGTAKGTVTAVNNTNQSRTVGGVVYTRDKTKDIAPTLVYTETTYSPYFSSNYAGSKNGIYDREKDKISTISSTNSGTLTGANGVRYTRYPFGDRNSRFEEIPAIVIGGNEHGTGGDPATPAMINARMIKDLCECKNMDNPFLNLLKNNYMVVFCPVVNPWGLHKDNKSYYNSKGVNLDRNFDTIGWGNDAVYPDKQGDYGGSENETQYFMNTLISSKAIIAMCNHSYGHGIDNTTGEAVSGGICSYMFGRNKSKYTETLLKIAEVMSANYNLVFTDNGEAPPENWAKTRSYFEAIGIEGVALEINSREGFITDPTNEAEGKQFTARVMEAGYTQLLQVLYMMISLANK